MWRNINLIVVYQIFYLNCAIFCNSLSMRLREKRNKGEVAEWSKAHAWKVCELQKGSAGSNPALSAGYVICGL